MTDVEYLVDEFEGMKMPPRIATLSGIGSVLFPLLTYWFISGLPNDAMIAAPMAAKIASGLVGGMLIVSSVGAGIAAFISIFVGGE